MTDFLVNKFIKDSTNIESTEVRTRYGMLTSVVGIFCNVLLFSVKLTIGLILSSLAVTADAFNNLSDAASSIISFIGVKMAGKPADAEHPFGHGRIEYIAALIVSFLVIEVGFTFFKSSISKILHPEEISFDLVPFVILILSILVKLWMAFFNNKLGKRIDSKVMLATAADSLGDVITTSATVLSIIICHFTSINVDAIAGLIVSAIVIWSGISIAKDTLEPLIGERVPAELYQKITDIVESYDGIVGTHDLIVHNYGPNRSMATIHAEVPNDINIDVSHEIIDKIERDVKKDLNILLVIHMDPVEMRDEEVLSLREKTSRIVHALDPELNFHDFRVLKENEQRNLIFDLVIPDSYSEKDANRVMHQLVSLLHEMDENVECIITLDRSFEAPES
ncbi:Dimerisation domain of Zinc Transporter [Anaerobutyricum hallii]|uniref:Dimerisation domain of Zinc Transporter n=1 Tax=Anaerobutyricum hallii TaxID=39488 RepID=A0A285PN41_9FIRM|nr:cation diffusion facilitator family transporter [Anaerobutyricum hallii]SOB71048.1 Dimerisation domain of Zinc Transporter [Anaerobutyricum hallii]